MIKKKAKKSGAAKKSDAARKSAKKKGDKKSKKLENRSPEEVRQDISKLVTADANALAGAVIGIGKTGQLAPVKFLFEMAHIFPKVNDGSEATKEEESLAETLLRRMDILPDKDEDDVVVIPAKTESEAVKAEKVEVHEEEEVPVG